VKIENKKGDSFESPFFYHEMVEASAARITAAAMKRILSVFINLSPLSDPATKLLSQSIKLGTALWKNFWVRDSPRPALVSIIKRYTRGSGVDADDVVRYRRNAKWVIHVVDHPFDSDLDDD
jgi:hypothetical protein